MNYSYSVYHENHKEKLELYRIVKLFISNFLLKMTDPLYVKSRGLSLYKYRNKYSCPGVDIMQLPTTLCYRIEKDGVKERFQYLDIKFIPMKIDRPYLTSENRNVWHIYKGRNTYNVVISYRGKNFIPNLIMRLYRKKFNIKGFTSVILSQNNSSSFAHYSNNNDITLLDFFVYTNNDFLDFENTKEFVKNWLSVITPIEYYSQLYHYVSDETYIELTSFQEEDEFSIKDRGLYHIDNTVSINDSFQLAQITTLGQVLNAILTG